jgi:hypothetical protein
VAGLVGCVLQTGAEGAGLGEGHGWADAAGGGLGAKVGDAGA